MSFLICGIVLFGIFAVFCILGHSIFSGLFCTLVSSTLLYVFLSLKGIIPYNESVLMTLTLLIVFWIVALSSINAYKNEHETIKVKVSAKSSRKSHGIKYEYYVADELKKRGFTNVEVTVASGDFGADIIANYKGDWCAIQCKHYSGSVGVHSVQEVLGAMEFYDCQVGMVITNSYFTPSAIKMANKTGVVLWGHFGK